jgi:hypothetical protein
VSRRSGARGASFGRGSYSTLTFANSATSFQIAMSLVRKVANSCCELPTGCTAWRLRTSLSDERPVGSLTLTIPESRFARSKLKAYVALLSEEARLLSKVRIS